MSSDYLIKKKALDDLGVIFSDDVCEHSGDELTFAKFPEYEHLREVYINTDDGSPEVHISCGGRFRMWLENNFLAKHNIEHEKF